MPEFGYLLSCEEHSPAEPVEQARTAGQAGFDSLWLSHPCHPWNDRRGQSPFARLLERFRRGGGNDPVSGGLKVGPGPDRREAVRTAHRPWANERLRGELPQFLPQLRD
jgi:hypothetical protein